MPALRIDCLGAPIDLAVTGPGRAEVEGRMAELWSRCLTAPGAAAQFRIEANTSSDPASFEDEGWCRISSADPQSLFGLVTRRVTLEGIKARTGSLLMLHAAALANPITGATAVLIGRSGTGKSTLCRVLGRRFGYVTDECAAVEVSASEFGSIVAYPKPLSLAPEVDHGKYEHSPDALGLLRPGPRPWLAAMAVLVRDGDMALPTVRPMPRLDAVAAIAQQTSALTRMSHPLQLLDRVTESVGGASEVRYGEAESLSDVIGGLLERTDRW